jgi:hypothetical protein
MAIYSCARSLNAMKNERETLIMITPQSTIDRGGAARAGVCLNLLKRKGPIPTGGLSFSR